MKGIDLSLLQRVLDALEEQEMRSWYGVTRAAFLIWMNF